MGSTPTAYNKETLLKYEWFSHDEKATSENKKVAMNSTISGLLPIDFLLEGNRNEKCFLITFHLLNRSLCFSKHSGMTTLNQKEKNSKIIEAAYNIGLPE